MIEILAGIDIPAEATRFMLVLTRTSGLMVFCPVLSSQLIPIRLRVLLGFALAVVLLPLVSTPSNLGTGVSFWLLCVVRELSVGFALGLGARVLLDGVEGAARVIAGQSGFAFSSMVDPITGAQSVSPALFQGLLATALFLSADLHHLFLRGLLHSYELLPPGPALLGVDGLTELVAVLGGRLFTLAVELAAPGLVVTFAVDLVLVLVGKALPQAPTLIVGYPLKIASGIVALGLVALATGSAIGWIGRTFATDGAAMLAAFGSK